MPPTPPSLSPADPTAIKRQHAKRALYILVGVFGLLFGFVALITFLIVVFVNLFSRGTAMAQAAEKVSTPFLSDMQANNPSAAYSLTSQSFKASNPSSSFAETVQEVHNDLSSAPSIQSYTVNDDNGVETAKIVYLAYGPDGSGNITVNLAENNSQWQVTSVDFPTFAQLLPSTKITPADQSSSL